jgi:hypothetical protein
MAVGSLRAAFHAVFVDLDDEFLRNYGDRLVGTLNRALLDNPSLFAKSKN